jgi:hypothetical protein
MSLALQTYAPKLTEEVILKLIADKVKQGQCILFLGAGVHCKVPDGLSFVYPECHSPPRGGSMAQSLAEKCDFADRFPRDDPRNLQRVALYYERQFSRKSLIDELKMAVDVQKKPSPALQALAELNFPLVITTNYDQLFERALRKADKEPSIAIYKSNEEPATDFGADPTPERPFVFKMHGDIGAPESIVITDEDYIQFVLRMSDKDRFHPVPMTFRYHFQRWPTLFIGYSLLDYNLRLLFKTLRWKMDRSEPPDTYSVDVSPDPLIVDVWENERRYIKFIALDVWTFVPRLYEAVTGKTLAT